MIHEADCRVARPRAGHQLIAVAVATLLFLGACSASGPHPRPATRAPATAATTPPSTTIGPAPAAAPPTTGPPPSSSHAPTRTLDPGPATTARTASQEVAGLAGATVVIDPGHNGGNSSHAAQIARPVFIGTGFRACDTTGTNTADGYTEAAYNLDVALRLAAILRAGGANVVLTRTSNEGVGPCIDERAAIGNRAHAAVAISIHADGGPPAGRGFHVNYPALVRGSTDGIVGPSYRLALDLRAAYQAGTGMPPSTYVGSGGLVARSDFGGLNLSTVPKVLFETANMRNATDAALTENAAFRQRVAQAFASGLAAFLTGK